MARAEHRGERERIAVSHGRSPEPRRRARAGGVRIGLVHASRPTSLMSRSARVFGSSSPSAATAASSAATRSVSIPVVSLCQPRPLAERGRGHARAVADALARVVPLRAAPRGASDRRRGGAPHRSSSSRRCVSCRTRRRRRRGRPPARATAGLAVGELRQRALGGGHRRVECTCRFGARLVPVARERGAVAVEVIGAQALDRLRERAVEAQVAARSGSRRAGSAARARARSGSAPELPPSSSSSPATRRGFERVDHVLLAVAGDRDDHVELEVLTGDGRAVQHRVAGFRAAR